MQLMATLENTVKKIDEFTPISCFFLWIITLIYISQNNITDLTDKFTISISGLLAFVAVFYTVIVITDFLKRLSSLNTKDISRLKNEINKFSKEETKNLEKNLFDENSELCNKKINVYGELSKIKNRKINRFLFISAFTIIIMLIIDNKFIPEVIFDIPNYKPYLLITGFWIVANNIVKIIVLLYKIYAE